MAKEAEKGFQQQTIVLLKSNNNICLHKAFSLLACHLHPLLSQFSLIVFPATVISLPLPPKLRLAGCCQLVASCVSLEHTYKHTLTDRYIFVSPYADTKQQQHSSGGSGSNSNNNNSSSGSSNGLPTPLHKQIAGLSRCFFIKQYYYPNNKKVFFLSLSFL